MGSVGPTSVANTSVCRRMKTMIGIHRIGTAPTDQECCPAPRDLWEILGDLWYTTSDCSTCPIWYLADSRLPMIHNTYPIHSSHIWTNPDYIPQNSVAAKMSDQDQYALWQCDIMSNVLVWRNERWCCDDTCTPRNLTWIVDDKIPQVEVESLAGGVDCSRGEVEFDMSHMIKKSHLLVQLSVLFATFAVIYW